MLSEMPEFLAILWRKQALRNARQECAFISDASRHFRLKADTAVAGCCTLISSPARPSQLSRSEAHVPQDGVYTPTPCPAPQSCLALYTILYMVYTPNKPLASLFTKGKTHGFSSQNSAGQHSLRTKVQPIFRLESSPKLLSNCFAPYTPQVECFCCSRC